MSHLRRTFLGGAIPVKGLVPTARWGKSGEIATPGDFTPRPVLADELRPESFEVR